MVEQIGSRAGGEQRFPGAATEATRDPVDRLLPLGVLVFIGVFDDAALYRFACGANTPAELVDPDAWLYEGPWLTVEGGEKVLVLGAHRGASGAICVDLYNTSKEGVSPVLRGTAVEGRAVQSADMLGRVQSTCPGGRVRIDPLAYARVTLPV